MNDEELYLRQYRLNLHVPSSAAVLGVGGTGSWVALFLALAGVRKVVIVDPDTLETHNLNRTPFEYRQAFMKMPKVSAMRELIKRRRPSCIVLAYQATEENEEVQEALKDVDVIIDCRDRLTDLPDWIQKKVIIRTGYDGDLVTIWILPAKKLLIGPNGYITPSYVVPPVIAAGLAVDIVLRPDKYSKDEKIISFEVDKILKEVKA